MMRLLALCLAILGVSFGAAAQEHVQAELVPEATSVQPGASAIVALKLTHDDGWHTYWESPGVGEATEIEWTLPDGWLADDIDWPVPSKILTRDGAISGHGFKGSVYLPIRLTVPASAPVGETVSLRAAVSWLVCEYEICIPGGADLTLDLPITSEPGAPVPSVEAALARQAMPEFGDGWSFDVTRDGAAYSMSITAPEPISDLHFFCDASLVEFCDDGFFWVNTEQVFETVSDSAATVSFTVDESFAEADIPALAGVLAFTDADGQSRGVLLSADVASGSAPAITRTGVQSIGWLQALVFAFLGGLILNLMPCVLPILSLKAISLAKMSGASPAAARMDGLVYTAGVILSFLIIAGILLGIRASMGAVGWGIQLQSPSINLVIVLIMVAVALNLFGVFEIGTRMTGMGQSLTSSKGYRGTFFTGMLAVIVAAPCMAPFMGPAVGFALVQPVAIALIVFAALGLGLATPYLILSAAPATRSLLPKPGPWMVQMKRILAFPMLGAAAYFLWVLGRQTNPDMMGLALLIILVLAFALWAWGEAARAAKSTVWKSIAVLGALLLIVSTYGFSQVAALISPSGPSSASHLFEETPYTRAALEEKLASGAPVFAYFTADWCIPCKLNENVAIKVESTADLFNSEGIEVVVGDWTNADPAITEMLTAYGRAGVPMYLYFPPGSQIEEGRLLPQVLTPGIIRSAIENAQS